MNKKRLLIVDDEVASGRIRKANLGPTGRYEAPAGDLSEAAGETAHRTLG